MLEIYVKKKKSYNEHFLHISFFTLSNVVLKWMYYFVLIVTPFQLEYIIIPRSKSPNSPFLSARLTK